MGSILPFIGTLKGALIGGAAMLIVGITGGWSLHQVFVAAKHEKELQAKIDTEADLRKSAEETATKMSEDLDVALANVRVEYRYINREIPNVVPQSPDCRLGPDFIRVFNRAANGGISSNAPAISYDQMSDEPIENPTNKRR